MFPLFTRQSLCAFLLTLCSHVAWAQQPQPAPKIATDQLTIPPRVLPLSPKEVLALLPPTPADWKVTTSAATNQISSWLVTIAQRQIESLETEKRNTTGTTAQSAPPMRTTFMLIDSGYDPSAAGAFADFKPAKNGNVEKAFFLNCPIIRTRPSATSESLQMLINRRFVFRVDAENQPKDAALRWAQQIPMEKYSTPQAATLTTLPQQVIIRSVDELNPRNDHESQITVATPTPTPR
jgi:hypothetical protein